MANDTRRNTVARLGFSISGSLLLAFLLMWLMLSPQEQSQTWTCNSQPLLPMAPFQVSWDLAKIIQSGISLHLPNEAKA